MTTKNTKRARTCNDGFRTLYPLRVRGQVLEGEVLHGKYVQIVIDAAREEGVAPNLNSTPALRAQLPGPAVDGQVLAHPSVVTVHAHHLCVG